MKKVIALMLAMVMVLGLCSMASAAAPTEKVQVNNMLIGTAREAAAEAKANEPKIALAETQALTRSTTTAAQLPPLANIYVGDDEENSHLVTNVGTNGIPSYTLYVFGTVNMSAVPVTFKASSSGDVTGNDGTNFTISAGETAVRTWDLSSSTTKTVSFTWNSAQDELSCEVTVVNAGSTKSLSLTSLSIGGSVIAPTSSAAGCILNTRYLMTTTGSVAALTVTAQLAGSAATATIRNDGSTTEVSPDANTTATFSNVNFTTGDKILTVKSTVGDEAIEREYRLSAKHLEDDETIVYLAIRTYTVFDWLDGETGDDYYVYESMYGSGADLSADEYNRIEAIATALQVYNTRTETENKPSSSVGNKRIFDEDSYCELVVKEGSSVMDALLQFLDQEGLYQTGAENNYVSSMGNGSATSAQIGEFDCGTGSGWMYTARDDVDDLASSLPNMGAKDWEISSGMYIDWYYTAAYGVDFGYSIWDL